jgi:catechol 2,3-dioxygenase-like lactoylglutathione lyase family enzyme
MELPTDNSYIGITTPHVREASDFYVRHFGYTWITDTEKFASVLAPNTKRCLGFSAPDDAHSLTPSGFHLVFLVENAAAALDEFRHRGIPITRELMVGSWGVRHFVVTDPAGVEIFISERVQQADHEDTRTRLSASDKTNHSA